MCTDLLAQRHSDGYVDEEVIKAQFLQKQVRFTFLQAVDEMDTRRRKILTTADNDINVAASKATIGKAMKDVKNALSFRPESKTLTKAAATAKEKVEVPEKKKKEPFYRDIPKVASLSHYKNSSNSQSFVPVECFDDEQKYLLYIERCRALPPLFLENKLINGKMRQILCDWLFQVQDRFTLEHDTLHLSFLMIDRCLHTMNIKKDKLQLLGATCVFIASKYEEVALPHITDFIYLAASSFTKRDILVMEREIFKSVNFNMGFAYPIHFLRRYRYALQNKDDTHTPSKLFIDLFMCTYELSHKLPSVMAQVSLYLAYFVSGKQFPKEMYPLMGITEKELKKECMDFIDPIITFSTTSKETSLHRKYKKLCIKPRLSEAQMELLKTLKHR